MDVAKTMEFILAQQAAYAAHQEEMAARQAALAARQDTFDERFAKLNAFQDSQQKSIYDLVQVVRGLATHAADSDQKIDRLTDNMNALIKVVDGLVRRDNGSHRA
jgi:ABC-type transporter Mla subunit MlaD